MHATHLLELLDKMYKYEMDPTRTVQARADTECGTDARSETNILPPQTTSLCGGITIAHQQLHTNDSTFRAGLVRNWPGQVEFV